ncbi:CHALLAH-LIKE 1, EPIDERMAL PATTERNING FACTOR-LIKE protein 5 [Zostera marina]|uniref:Epidermal patterning factor-like protein n=1 Tax=Zostera marina TaxID=29655 RepID=A0A0K9PCH8_ZOSMR|nr:CHALLAH-LIKE 1, EPIDERMAL PATTERNING FACTOR-LIKE protein 5 [Zostera marina]
MGIHSERWVVICVIFLSSLLLLSSHQQQQQQRRHRYHHHHHWQYRKVSPGSSPPKCRYKCGSCSPCVPVPVIIHAGFFVPLEYYPEAWRCKCGDKLFMP